MPKLVRIGIDHQYDPRWSSTQQDIAEDTKLEISHFIGVWRSLIHFH